MPADHIPQNRPEDLSTLPEVAADEPGVFLTGYDRDNQARLVRVALSELAKATDIPTSAEDIGAIPASEKGAPGGVARFEASLSGKQVWVDSVNGNDATGARGRRDKPFLTLTAAKNAALSGDTIHVSPGTYNERNLLKDGVNWWFDAGAIVEYSGSEIGAVFDDSESGTNSNVTCQIGGSGVFIYSGSAVDDARNSVFYLDSQSRITASCNHILHTEESGLSSAVWISNAELKLTCQSITSSGAAAVWWSEGDAFIEAQEITGGGPLAIPIYVTSPADSASDMWLTAKLIKSNAMSLGVMHCFAQSPDSRAWFRVTEINHRGSTGGAVEVQGGKIYVEAQKISGELSDSPVVTLGDGELWLTAQKVTTGTGAAVKAEDGGAGSGYFRLHNIDASSCVSSALDLNLGVTVECQEVDCGAQANGVVGFAYRLIGARIRATGVGRTPIITSVEAATLDRCILIGNASGNSIDGDAPVNVLAVFANRAVAGTVTQQVGTVTVSADVF